MSLTWDDTPAATPPAPRLQAAVPNFVSPAYSGVLSRTMPEDLQRVDPTDDSDAAIDARFQRVRADEKRVSTANPT